MPLEPPPQPPAATSTIWRADPSVLTARFGNDLAAYHLRTGRSYRLPGLPERIRELLETGCELDVAAAAPNGDQPGGGERGQPELEGLMEMLEREQLIVRASEAARGGARRGDHSELFLVISADRAGEGDHRDAPQPALRAGTVLQRAPRVVVELTGGRTRVSLGGHQEQAVNGGAYALRLLDAFERPRTVHEVIRVLQGRLREVQGWIGLIEALVRLFEGGVLCDVKLEERPGWTGRAPQAISSR